MLSKLIKHEFRATSRIMWPVFLGMLALTALMRFSQLLLNGGHIPWLLQLIGVLLVIGFMMGLGALAFVPLVLSAVRWRDHVLKDEGYLTLTLPVSLHQLLISKLIVSAVWFALTLIVVGLACLIVAADVKVIHQIAEGLGQLLGELCRHLTAYYAINGTALAVEFLVLCFVGCCAMCLQF